MGSSSSFLLNTFLIGFFLAPAHATYYSAFSNAFSTGPVAVNSWIRESNTTLVLPDTNTPQTGNLALWPGMGTSAGDLVQALAISVADGSAGCPKTEGKWCVTASTLQDNTQEMGALVTAEPGDHMTIHYKFNAANSSYDQTVSLNGRVVSRLSTASGHAQGWGTAVECQAAACGRVPAHKYINTKIIMDVADPTYDQTLVLTNATGDLVTSDGGLTWTVDVIHIDASTFTS